MGITQLFAPVEAPYEVAVLEAAQVAAQADVRNAQHRRTGLFAS